MLRDYSIQNNLSDQEFPYVWALGMCWHRMVVKASMCEIITGTKLVIVCSLKASLKIFDMDTMKRVS